ncbi:MAG: hypothetical protein JXQ87_06050 [Bacteroidia bacterium]
MRFTKSSFLFLLACLIIDSHELHASADSLEAILIVGHQEDLTENAKDEMNDVALIFRENGVKVHKFYNEKAEWDEIKKLSGKCSFLVYSGHGSTLGENGGAGGLCIESLVTSEEMMNEFKLKESAVVCFQSVCMGTGSTAGDFDDISDSLAKARVTSYSKPFLEIGAAAYVAVNYSNGVEKFLESFFNGSTMVSAYNSSFYPWSDVEIDEVYKHDTTKRIVLASSPGGGMATYTKWVNGKKTTKRIITPKSFNAAMVGDLEFEFEIMKERDK